MHAKQMNSSDIRSIERIKIDLLHLKPYKFLKEVHQFFEERLKKYFDEKGVPIKSYFEDVVCQICDSSNYRHKFEIDNFEYRECTVCKSVYNSPRIKGEILDKMYQSGEYNTYFKKLTVSSQKLRKSVIDQRKYKQINSFFENPGKLLDVGCGTGSFLKVCKENGWTVFGVDPSKVASDIALEKYGLEVKQKYFESYKTSNKYDCITFWGQLEHVHQPMKFIKKAVSLLTDNGILQFEVPSANCFLMSYLEKNLFSPYRYIENARHLQFFSLTSIDIICSVFDLELAHIESNGLDLQTILLNDYKEDDMEKIVLMQQTIDELLLGDHYRVFLKKRVIYNKT
jgi:2-polyprenyl-3-methyl-5-hydroxy-6-metoxy-1,4-benzoquinol methylase